MKLLAAAVISTTLPLGTEHLWGLCPNLRALLRCDADLLKRLVFLERSRFNCIWVANRVGLRLGKWLPDNETWRRFSARAVIALRV